MAGYSEEYKRIRKEAEEKWPQWKIDYYNANFAISAHAKKLERKLPVGEEVCKMRNLK